MSLTPVQPAGWNEPRGYSNGMLAPAGAQLCFISGQIAWDAQQRLVGAGDFALQFRTALSNVLAVVAAAGGAPEHLAQLTVFVTDKRAYESEVKQLGAIWRELCGRHYPSMALVEVAGLLEPGALVEIQGLAAITKEPSA